MSDALCLSCLKPLPLSEGIKCLACKNDYHKGKCSGLTKAALKNMSKSDADPWTCPTCVSGASRSSRKKRDSQSRRNRDSQSDKSDDESATSEPSLKDVISSIMALSAKLHEVLDRLDMLERSGEMQNVKHDDALLKLTEQQKSIEARL
ncbi:hypothetical protein HPB48_001491 [Haemaphysalis longicornis]|uniref:PHD-type domain-containing protein n=1 Tax=Haemaphysalis longicornis TaxID=44386 RepID=A0A9J6F7A9_HAELO|nr:hypothetical protein HPB48_001491 [Haemaphysalis longicornis]